MATTLKDDLRTLFEKTKLPTSPAIAAQILQLIDDPDSSAAQFTTLIQADPALAARLLKMANSAAYAQRSQATTIKRAVTLLGLRQLRVLVLGFELVSHLDRLGATPFDLPTFWKMSVLRACIARETARRVVPTLEDEAFLLGLLQDCGVIPLAQTLGPAYGELCQADHAPAVFFEEERSRFPYTHADAIATLASMWGLPEKLAGPMGRHHECPELGETPTDAERLAAVSYFVGTLPFTTSGRVGDGDPALGKFASGILQLDEDAVSAILETAGASFAPVAELFGDALPADLDVTDLLLEANRQLQRQATESERHMRDVEAERDRILGEQVTLRNALGQYRQQAARDPLTGLLNRRALLDATVYCIRRAELAHSAVTVLFMDLDDFKAINDTLGHTVGDAVLRVVADTIRSVIKGGGFAGRYGGEEFVVVVPDLDEKGAREFSEEMLTAVRHATVLGVPLPRGLTCSIGAIWCEPRRGMSPEGLLGRADELMYAAKHAGKDRCCFQKHEAPESHPAAAGAPPAPDRDLAETLMPPSIEHVRRLAERLNREQSSWGASNRKQVRLGVCVPCTVCLFMGTNESLQREEAYVRNISSGGVGLLSLSPLVRGDLVEVILEVKGEPLYLAGVVAYCNKVEEAMHDVGVQLYQHDREPILSRSTGPLQDLDWVAQVLGECPGVESAIRRSA